MNFARLFSGGILLATIIATVSVLPAHAASDRNMAEFFARVRVDNIGKYRPVEALARSEKWPRTKVAQVPAGMPRPSRAKAWLVEIGRKVVVVVAGTFNYGGVNIDTCSVVGSATRSSINAVIRANRAKQVATFSDAVGTGKVYDGQNAGRPVAISVIAIEGGYWLQATQLPQGTR
jgi:hypothetical protein